MHAFVVRKQKAQSQNQRKANMRKRVVYFALKMELFCFTLLHCWMQLHSIDSCPAKILSLLFV